MTHPVVDAHCHIFQEVRGQVAAGPTSGLGYGRMAVGETQMQMLPPYNPRTEFTAEMLVANMDWAGVDRAVLLQGTFYGECDDYTLAALRAYPGRLAGALFADPWRAGFREDFDRLVDNGGFRAAKIEFSDHTGLSGVHPSARLDGEEVAWLWGELERLKMVLVLDLGAPSNRSYQTEAVGKIAERHRDLRIVIAHLGQPRPAEAEALRKWEEQIDLGGLPNVFFDAAALIAILPAEEYPYPKAALYLGMAMDRIGRGKIMWGTDQPGLLKFSNYPQLLQMAKRHSKHLSSDEQALFLGGTAQAVYFD